MYSLFLYNKCDSCSKFYKITAEGYAFLVNNTVWKIFSLEFFLYISSVKIL